MISRIMSLCTVFILASSAVLAQSSAQPSGQPADDAVAEEAQQHIDQGSDSILEIFELSRYTFRDLTLYWENDGTLPNLIDDTDRYYTNGTGIEVSFDPNLTPALESRLAISRDPNQRFGVGIAIKQKIFTPADITLPNPPARDHPYVGHLELLFAFQRADDTKHDHFGLSLGLTGHSSGSEGIQQWIHNTFPDEFDPLGWGTQHPGEPTINFAYTRTWKSKAADIGGLEMEMLPSLGFDLGTVSIAARSAMTLRIGKNLPTDFGPASLLGHKDHTVRTSQSRMRPDGTEPNWSFYSYARIGVDAIARDLYLDGTAFVGSRSAQREPLVATFTLGIVAQYESFYLGWAQHFQTERFELQPDEQTWGSIVFGCSFEW